MLELIYQIGGKNAKSYFQDYFKNNYTKGLPKDIENIILNNKEISLKSRNGIFSIIDNQLDLESQRIMKRLHSNFFAKIYAKNVKNRPEKINNATKSILDKYIELFNKKSKNNTYMNNSNGNNKNNNSFLNNASVSSNSNNNNNNPLGLPVAPNNKPNDPSNMGTNMSNNASNMSNNVSNVTNTSNATTLPNNNSSNFEYMIQS